MSSIDLFEAIHTQRAIRRFKPDPIPGELVYKLLDAAIRAPSASNRQPWNFLVITDNSTKQKIGEFYKKAWEINFGTNQTNPDTLKSSIRISAQYLAEHIGEAPLLLLACIQTNGTLGTTLRGSSIYPAVQNLMLAARALGIGSVITTMHTRYEQEIKTLLEIPDNVETAALIPLGYPMSGEHFGENRRTPVENVTFKDRWGSSWDFESQ